MQNDESENSEGQGPIDIEKFLWANAASAQKGLVVFEHARVHQHVQAYCEEVVDVWRRRVGIEDVWAIEIEVACQEQMEGHEATIWWDEQCWYALMSLSCGHMEPMLEWLCVHELCELRRWRTSSHYFQVHSSLLDGIDKERLVQQYHVYRNQEIESEVYQLLGRRRPFHMRATEK